MCVAQRACSRPVFSQIKLAPPATINLAEEELAFQREPPTRTSEELAQRQLQTRATSDHSQTSQTPPAAVHLAGEESSLQRQSPTRATEELAERQLRTRAASNPQTPPKRVGRWRAGGAVDLALNCQPEVREGVSRVAVETRRGRFVLAGGCDGSFCLMDLQKAGNSSSSADAPALAPTKLSTLALLPPSADDTGGHCGIVEAACWLPSDDQLFVTGGDTRMKIWDAAAPDHCVMTVPLHSTIRAAAITDGSPPTVVVALHDNTSRLVDLRHGRTVITLQGHTMPPLCVAWGAPGDQRVFSGGADGTIRAWDTRMGARSLFLFDFYADKEGPALKRLKRTEIEEAAARELDRDCANKPLNQSGTGKFVPYRRTSLTSCFNSLREKTGGQFNRTAGTFQVRLETEDRSHGRPQNWEDVLAAKLQDRAAMAHRHLMLPPRREYEHEPACAHRGAIVGLAFPTPRHGVCSFSRLLSCGVDGQVRSWDTATGVPAATSAGDVSPHSFKVDCWNKARGLCIGAAGAPEDVCLVPELEKVGVYCLRTGELLCHLVAHTGAVSSVQYLATRDIVLTAGMDGRLLAWRIGPEPGDTATICLD
jgi:WD40 repeat protein